MQPRGQVNLGPSAETRGGYCRNAGRHLYSAFQPEDAFHILCNFVTLLHYQRAEEGCLTPFHTGGSWASGRPDVWGLSPEGSSRCLCCPTQAPSPAGTHPTLLQCWLLLAHHCTFSSGLSSADRKGAASLGDAPEAKPFSHACSPGNSPWLITLVQEHGS